MVWVAFSAAGVSNVAPGFWKIQSATWAGSPNWFCSAWCGKLMPAVFLLNCMIGWTPAVLALASSSSNSAMVAGGWVIPTRSASFLL